MISFVRSSGGGSHRLPGGFEVVREELADLGDRGADVLRAVVEVDVHAAFDDVPEREVAARDRMSAVPDLCVATSTRDLFYRDPLGPVWLPLTEDRRVPLLWLPLVIGRRSTP